MPPYRNSAPAAINNPIFHGNGKIITLVFPFSRSAIAFRTKADGPPCGASFLLKGGFT
jgi:hypothetical protein